MGVRRRLRVTQGVLIELGVAAALALAAGWFLAQRGLWRAEAFGKTKAQQRDIAGVPAPIWFVSGAMVYLSQVVFLTTFMELPESTRGADKSLKLLALSTTTVYAGAIGLCLIILYLLGPKLSERSGTRVRLSDTWIGLGCLLLTAPAYVLTSLAAQMVYALISSTEPPALAHDTLETIVAARTDAYAQLLVFAVVILAPMVEEFIYRLCFQACLVLICREHLGRWGAKWGTWTAIVVTSAIFALGHVKLSAGPGPVPWVGIPGLFMFSLCLGIAYERTRRLGVPIVMHMGFNAANVAIAIAQS
jgi:membrane protease YdiL (CAAX protease family)